MAGPRPEVFITQLVDKLSAKFQWLTQCFRCRVIGQRSYWDQVVTSLNFELCTSENKCGNGAYISVEKFQM
jgi:hypothetical protein